MRKLKALVNVNWKVSPAIDAAQDIIIRVYKSVGAIATCTSAKDGRHSAHSAHHQDVMDPRPADAIDLRIWNLFRDSSAYEDSGWWERVYEFCEKLALELNKAKLGSAFYVVLEKDHIHLEACDIGDAPNIQGYVKGCFVYATSKVKAALSEAPAKPAPNPSLPTSTTKEAKQ